MSRGTLDILERWVAETVRPVPVEEIEKEAERLATEFSAFAADAGINIENLETEITEDLPSYMADALRAATVVNGDNAPGSQDLSEPSPSAAVSPLKQS
jgi:hypothetical protein